MKTHLLLPIFLAAVPLVGCASDRNAPVRDTDQTFSAPSLNTNPTATDTPRNVNNLPGSADPNGGVTTPNGIRGNVGGR